MKYYNKDRTLMVDLDLVSYYSMNIDHQDKFKSKMELLVDGHVITIYGYDEELYSNLSNLGTKKQLLNEGGI